MSISEFTIIEKYFREVGLAVNREEVVLGIGDDAALLSPPAGRQLVITTDMLVESVHFPADADPARIAARALAVNLSDLAAMGAEPLCFTLGLVLSGADEQWLHQFSHGLAQTARRYHIALVGGDLSRGPAATIAIQAHGLVDPGRVLRRDRAKEGDRIFVTGCPGDGAVALAALGLPTHLGESFRLKKTPPPAACLDYFEQVYYEPGVQIELARRCAPWISSAIDISDGLMGDLGHICKSSGVGAELKAADFPVSSAARCCVSPDGLLRAALHGGDDYQLCLTVAPENQEAFMQQAEQTGPPPGCIGVITAEPGIRCLDADGQPVAIENRAYEHFRDEKNV